MPLASRGSGQNEDLANFFVDDLLIYEALVVVLNLAMQAKIAKLLVSDAPTRFHSASYNMLSYAFSTA